MESLMDRQVTVLGCGNMGSALIRTLADAGYEVTAWNRTYGRAEALTCEHVVAMRSARDAASASPMILACVSVYSVLQQVLESIGDISGKTLINLTTGSPREAEVMASWAAAHQVGYLDGVITVYPRQIGNRDAQIMISGPTDLWLAHQASLLTLAGAARHVSESPSLANVLDVGLVGAFYIAALTAFMEATAFALDCGVTSEAMLATARPSSTCCRERRRRPLSMSPPVGSAITTHRCPYSGRPPGPWLPKSVVLATRHSSWVKPRKSSPRLSGRAWASCRSGR